MRTIKILLISAVLLFSKVCLAADNAHEKKLGVTFDLTYTSKWLSKGIEAYGSKGGLFKSVDFDFYGTGFGLKVTHRNATSSGFVDSQRIDYRPYLKGSLFDNTKYLIKYDIGVSYESYTGLSRNKANTTYEWMNSFYFPNLLSCGLVPGYIFYYEYPASSGNANRRNNGAVHAFLLGYDMKVPELKNPPQIVNGACLLRRPCKQSQRLGLFHRRNSHQIRHHRQPHFRSGRLSSAYYG